MLLEAYIAAITWLAVCTTASTGLAACTTTSTQLVAYIAASTQLAAGNHHSHAASGRKQPPTRGWQKKKNHQSIASGWTHRCAWRHKSIDRTLDSMAMSRRGMGGKGLGKGSMKCYRKVLHNNVQSITKSVIHCLNVIPDTVIHTEHAQRKTITTMDVIYALKRQRRTLYGLVVPDMDPAPALDMVWVSVEGMPEGMVKEAAAVVAEEKEAAVVLALGLAAVMGRDTVKALEEEAPEGMGKVVAAAAAEVAVGEKGEV
ncbi:hypothetical protein ZIOFF_019598 [Zingiber officinale]|uniref:Histone H4 n=1 Tax=Zingiber officinale TaxID=94328 RepID=A0A8J5HI34_ZINOF|nr:hypothetical protein ZIOFF_019598 [Zingiber officinale]